MTLLQIGNNIEYFVHEYNPQESTAASRDGINAKYTFRLLKNSILPTFPKTFSHMSILLESLLHYKVKEKKKENIVKVEMG